MRLSLFNLTWIAVSVVSSLTISFSSVRAETDVYVDNNCRQVSDSVLQSLSEPPWFQYQNVFYGRKFTANNENYWLYAARTGDGSVQFCISQPNFVNPQVINADEISYQFIESINQAGDNNPTFTVQVREGQNTNSPFIDYRLNLSNPNQPIVTLIRRGCCIN